MAKSSPADVIDSYRRRQQRRSPFTFADISQGLLFILILASAVYISITGGPKLPTIIELKTNTPTYTPSITPTPTMTATITSTPTETPDPEKQCDCPSPIVLVVTATFEASHASIPLASASATLSSLPTSTPAPSESLAPTETLPPTSTPRLYTVQRNDTLSGIALRFGVSVEAIQALNNLSNTIIREGQVLQIPAK
jgi:LysM repeat protein